MKSTNSILPLALLFAGIGCVVALSRRPAPRSFRPERKFLNPPPPTVQGQLAVSDEISAALAQAENRTWQYLNACSKARKRNDRAAAYEHLEGAKEEVRRHLKIDHHVNAEVLNMWGCLRHDEGLVTDARHLWEAAGSVASEWPDTCRHLIPVIVSNLRLVS
jgi:hypothetical protein